MTSFFHETTVDIHKRPPIEYIGCMMYTGDAYADVLKITVLDGGNPASISGSVVCKVVRPDNVTTPAEGSISGNVVTVALPPAAYILPGNIRITVKIADNGVITSIYGAVATIATSETDSIIDPGTIIPSIEALIAEINAVRATIPADYSALANQVSSNSGSINTLNAQTAQNSGNISALQTQTGRIAQNLGDMNQLVTPTKDDIVQAINEAYEYDPSADYDDALSPTSENAVQNKVLKAALDGKMNKPVTGGTAGQCLMSDGEGSLVFGTPTNVGVVLGNLALKDRAKATYTPKGKVSAPKITVTPTTKQKFFAGSVSGGGSVAQGTAADCKLPTLVASYDAQSKTLALNWTAGSFTANVPTGVVLPTFTSDDIVTGVAATASAPTFTGTEEEIVST